MARRPAVRILHGATQVAATVMVALIVLTFVLGRVVPAVGGRTYVIAGGSMEPGIPKGAAVVDEPVAPEAVRAGEVVTLRVPGAANVVTHRVILVTRVAGELMIRTKGDANAAPDPTLVRADWVVGRTILVLPGAGYLLALMSFPAGVLFLFSLAGVLIVAGWFLETFHRPRGGRLPHAGPHLLTEA